MNSEQVYPQGDDKVLKALRWCLIAIFVMLLPWQAPTVDDARLFLTGLLVALVLSTFVGRLIKLSIQDYNEDYPGGENPLAVKRQKRGPWILGLLEAGVFFAALYIQAELAVAGWLGFKAASKWASWQHLTQLPEHRESDSRDEYLRWRHGMASQFLTGFLVGTLANICAALCGLGFVWCFRLYLSASWG